MKATLTDILDNLGDQIHDNKRRQGWNITTPDKWKDTYEIPAVLMLITTEVAEAMEAFRHSDIENFEEELADIIIRVVGLSYGLGIDLGNAIETKMLVNKTRSFKHENKRL